MRQIHSAASHRRRRYADDRIDSLRAARSGAAVRGRARALANRPALLLADEPTGELDDQTSGHIADLFDRVNADGTAILVVTHNPALAARASRRLAMASGRVLE